MPYARHMEARLAIGDGKNVGTKETGIKMIGGIGIRAISTTARSSPTTQIKMSKCSCGRSPTGLCVGWHALKKKDYEKKKKKYEELSEDEKKVAFHVRAIDGIGE